MQNLLLEASKIHIVLILTFGFAFASIFGYLAQKAKCSPILGYLIAGYLIGPYSPGFVADMEVSKQLAEIGVILMMFGVGLHLNWQDLVSVKNIAVPGALIQTLATTIAATVLTCLLGWQLEAGVVVGLAIGVASTVVMVRVFSDNFLDHTPQGHLAIGWTIVEDILTVVALLLLPPLVSSLHGEQISFWSVLLAISIALLKCAALVAVTAFAGIKLVSYVFFEVTRTRSQELFTLTVLALIFSIATGSALIFGTSIALGAFIAGLVIGQTDVRHQASANALPLKDTFAVIFFLSVGMLANPQAIFSNLPLFAGILFIILAFKPLIAFLIIILLKRPFHSALAVAFALAQIGEFSFILSGEAVKFDILPEEGYNIIVGCALISIAINPFLFKAYLPLSKWMEGGKYAGPHPPLIQDSPKEHRAIVVGFGPIGQDIAGLLAQFGVVPVIVETNMETVAKEKRKSQKAIFGDATDPHILEAAHAKISDLLIITTADITTTLAIIRSARHLNPRILIMARALYAADKSRLKDLGAIAICDEEETRRAFMQVILERRV